jgi:hypothetical protein
MSGRYKTEPFRARPAGPSAMLSFKKSRACKSFSLCVAVTAALLTSDLSAESQQSGPPLLLPPGLSVVNSSPAAVEDAQPEDSLPIPGGRSVRPSTNDRLEFNVLEPSEPTYWYVPGYWIGPTPWDTSIEFGLNGSTGTSDSLSIRAGGAILRESRFSKLDLDATYNSTTTGGTATQHNAQLNARNDWLLHESSPWTLYAAANSFYDEFQAFDLQANANSGIGYRFLHEPGLDIIGRFGGGASREIGGPDDRWVPESHVGFEYSQRLSATQRFYGKLDYFPEWDQVGEYRLVADAGWEIDFIQPSNMSLKLSATDRFDSTPNGADPHVVNYSLLLLLKL